MKVNKAQLKSRFSEKIFEFRSESEIARILRVSPAERGFLKTALDALVAEGFIVLDKNRKYATAERVGAKRGKVQMKKDFAFFIPEDGSGDWFLSRKSLKDAQDGDTVLCRRSLKASASSDEGEVLTVLSRSAAAVVGIFLRMDGGGIAEPVNRKNFGDIYIEKGATLGAKTGDRVLIKITRFPERGYGGEGEITKIFPKESPLITEENTLLAEAGLPESFPEEVEKESEENARFLIGGERENRTDHTGLFTVTIDGADTRDLDDAISVRVDPDGTRELFVHIADVAHFVPRGGKTDREAFSRATSVYFPDRVIPMLPKVLSNGVCSLNEGEERLALTCRIVCDRAGTPLRSFLEESVIRNDRRLTYDEVNGILKGKSADPQLYETLKEMQRLAEAFSARRNARGAVDLDTVESAIYCKDGKISVTLRERGESERIIEEFMIAANEAVASFAARAGLPFVYRTHESPSEEKLAAFSAFLRGIGQSFTFDAEKILPEDFQRVLERCEDQPYGNAVRNVMLRSMQKARYTPQNKGHFGLASTCYCHFTSPIRRYPDLTVHRILKEAIHGGNAESFRDFCQKSALQSSEREVLAEKIERTVDDLYKTAFLSERIGEKFPATVSGVTAFGVFAEIGNGIEGLIFPEELPEDVYLFDAERLSLKGKKHSYRLGDPVEIEVKRCDLTERKIDFSVVTEEAKGGVIRTVSDGPEKAGNRQGGKGRVQRNHRK